MMLFSSISFIYIFMPAVLLVYYLVPKGAKNAVLLAASILFYSFGEPVYVLLLAASSLIAYFHSLYIESHRGTVRARRALISSTVLNIALLGFFKYADFAVGTVNSVLSLSLPMPGIKLPVGISFFTFQTMSYTIDVYRGRVHAERSLVSLATFVCLFPQLIAGPIVRYTDVSAELSSRETCFSSAADGVRRFVVGMGKKVLIANAMGEFCTAFSGCGNKSVLFYWLYAIAFTLQIYFDFSGYSDMAIGLGKMFGFSFPENFDYPYISRSVTEFWRRWHMTLGTWFRDYVYIPLGGNRCSTARHFLNIMLVWLLTGLWHGASWNYVIWGGMYGVLLILEKLFLGNVLKKSGKILPRIYVMFFVTVGFVIFNASDISQAGEHIKGLFGLMNVPLITADTLYYLKSYAILFIIAVIGSTPLPARLFRKVSASKLSAVVEPALIAAAMIVITAYLVDGSFNPFLYFRF